MGKDDVVLIMCCRAVLSCAMDCDVSSSYAFLAPQKKLKLGLVILEKLARAVYTLKLCNKYIRPRQIGHLVKATPP